MASTALSNWIQPGGWKPIGRTSPDGEITLVPSTHSATGPMPSARTPAA